MTGRQYTTPVAVVSIRSPKRGIRCENCSELIVAEDRVLPSLIHGEPGPPPEFLHRIPILSGFP